MKKIFIIIVTILIFSNFSLVKANNGITNTGHATIEELDFLNKDADYRLLNQMSETTINNYLSQVKRKGFGWNIKTINKNIPIWYISETVFSKSNNTFRDLEFNYTIKQTQSRELEISVAGSLAAKGSGKIKSVSASLDAEIKGEIRSISKTFYEESQTFKLYIPKRHKISLLVKGEGSVSTGVAKYFFFGFTAKKGTWEYIDLETEYYEYYEEVL